MPMPESMAGAHDLDEELILALPAHRWGAFWFGALRPTPVRLHVDPAQQRCWFTDAQGRLLPTDRCETLGGEQVVAAKDRLMRLHHTRQGITGRIQRRPDSPATQTPPPLAVAPPFPATGAGVATTPDGRVEVAPFSDGATDPPARQPGTERTTSVFRRRGTKVADVIARVKNTDRLKRTAQLGEESGPSR